MNKDAQKLSEELLNSEVPSASALLEDASTDLPAFISSENPGRIEIVDHYNNQRIYEITEFWDTDDGLKVAILTR